MTKFLLRWVINAVAFYLAVRFVPGITLGSGWLGILWLALIFGLINAFLRPILQFLTCPLIILTLGLFTLLINTFLFWLTARIGGLFGIQISVAGFWPALLGGIVVSVVSMILSMILKEELKGRRHKR